MFKINDDLSISLTRGDTVSFDVTAKQGDVDYIFEDGDTIVFKVSEAKDAGAVLLKVSSVAKIKEGEPTTKVTVSLTDEQTASLTGGTIISKPVEFWYEIALENDTRGKVRQTLIGYDEDGAKILRLFPEIGDMTQS